MRDREVNEAFYQPDNLWTADQAIRGLYKIMFSPKIDVTSWLVKQSLFASSCYEMAKPNRQHQFDLLYVPYNVFEGNTYE